MSAHEEEGPKRLALLLDDCRGIHIPAVFARDFVFGPGHWQGVEDKDLAVLKDGPDHEWYWEAWEDVLRHAYFIASEKVAREMGVPVGSRITLEQDGALWAVLG